VGNKRLELSGQLISLLFEVPLFRFVLLTVNLTHTHDLLLIFSLIFFSLCLLFIVGFVQVND
jgi:hypothetical protein